MSHSDVKKAFEKKLLSNVNGFSKSDTAFEGVNFKPLVDKPYQRVNLYPTQVENPTVGDNYHRLTGFFQVVLSYPNGQGTGDMYDMVDKVTAFFKRGTTLVENSTKVVVDRTPDISPPYANESRMELTIRIRYYSEQI